MASRGRPKKPDGERKGWNINFRSTKEVQCAVVASAAIRGISINAEIHRRLVESLHAQDLESLIKKAVREAAGNHGFNLPDLRGRVGYIAPDTDPA